MQNHPLVSIAMPVCNTEKTLALAIRSIMRQTYKNWELIIIDDGSIDQTLAVAKNFEDPRLRISSDGFHKGLPVRLNETIELSSGKYYARMDGDDIAYPKRLERQVRFLEEHPEVDLVGAWMLVFGKNGVPSGKRAGVLNYGWQYKAIFRSIPLAHPTFVGRKEWFEKNRYPEWAKNFEDQALLMKTAASSKLAVVPEILLGYREETLTIAKQWRYRSSYFLVSTHLTKEHGVLRTILIVGSQFAKLTLDMLAIVTRLHYRLLRHRARPLTAEEKRTWEQVWQSIIQPSKLSVAR